MTEETLEAPVGKGVDVSTHKNRFILYNSAAKIHFFIETAKNFWDFLSYKEEKKKYGERKGEELNFRK